MATPLGWCRPRSTGGGPPPAAFSRDLRKAGMPRVGALKEVSHWLTTRPKSALSSKSSRGRTAQLSLSVDSVDKDANGVTALQHKPPAAHRIGVGVPNAENDPLVATA
jgi:hypothetical protein